MPEMPRREVTVGGPSGCNAGFGGSDSKRSEPRKRSPAHRRLSGMQWDSGNLGGGGVTLTSYLILPLESGNKLIIYFMVHRSTMSLSNLKLRNRKRKQDTNCYSG